MEKIKYNDATYNRPDGERVVDADYVFADLEVFIHQLKEEKSWVEGDRNSITIFKSEPVTIVLVVLKPGAAIIENNVRGFVTAQVMEGEVRVCSGEDRFDAPRNQLITFHPEVVHTIEAREESVLLLITVHEQKETTSL